MGGIVQLNVYNRGLILTKVIDQASVDSQIQAWEDENSIMENFYI